MTTQQPAPLAKPDDGTVTPHNTAIVVMARSPDGARAPKSRLAGVLPNTQDRRRLYAAFLADTVAMSRSIKGATLRVAYTSDGGMHGFDRVGVTAQELLPQRDGSLGDRERGVFEDLFHQGFSRVVMIGSDLPTLPPARIVAALAQLNADHRRVVLGPATDGGYYLLGLAVARSAPSVPDLFSDINWSTESTLADTLAAAMRCGRKVALLDAWHDVDDEGDLARLRQELVHADGEIDRRAPLTSAVLSALNTDRMWE